jgi:hypothetical protein
MPSRCEGWSEEVGPWNWIIHCFISCVKLFFHLDREGVKSGSEVLNFGIEGSNFGIDVLDVSLVLGVVVLQGKDVVLSSAWLWVWAIWEVSKKEVGRWVHTEKGYG